MCIRDSLRDAEARLCQYLAEVSRGTTKKYHLYFAGGSFGSRFANHTLALSLAISAKARSSEWITLVAKTAELYGRLENQ